MNKEEDKNKVLNWYINNLNWSIVPVGNNKFPLVSWKNRQENPYSVEELNEDWRKLSMQGKAVAGLAVVTGKISGVIVVDIDFKNGGEDFLKDCETPTAITGGGGKHYFFKYTPGVRTAGGIRKGVDIRSDGGIAVLPPSTHPSGNRYTWLKEPGKVPFAEFPSSLLEELKSKPQLSIPTTFDSTPIEAGERNVKLTQFVGKELAKHKPNEWGLVHKLALAYNEEYCDPPLQVEEVNTIFESISRAESLKYSTGEKTVVLETDNLVTVTPLIPDSDKLSDFLEEVEQRKEYNRQGRLAGLTTGFKHLDEVTLGLQMGLWVIGAGTSVGKTTFVKQLVDMVVSNNDVPALFISYEQSHFELFLKSISRYSQVDSRKIQKGRFTSTEEKIMQESVSKFSNFAKKIYTVEGGSVDTLDVIKMYAKEIMARHESDKILICIDYLQLIPANQDKSFYRSTKEKLDYVCSDLRALARDLNSPIIAVSSFNRSSYGKGGTADITSFKESGGVEYSADVAMVMEDNNEDTAQDVTGNPYQGKKVVTVRVVKNRNGERASLSFEFDMARATFIEEGRDDRTPGEVFTGSM